MKTLPILLGAVALCSCTTTPTTTTTASSQRETVDKRVHTREELERTGFQNVGESLEAVDSSVTATGGR
ncbi:MAG: hypothetical protein H0X73_04035 [Chthoniobacterales bacterium]|nr:hypothetical protein [Chthoniobacterales bacterium]